MIRQGVECSPKKGQSSVCLGPLRSPPIHRFSSCRHYVLILFQPSQNPMKSLLFAHLLLTYMFLFRKIV